MSHDPTRRRDPRRSISGVEPFCYKAAPGAGPRIRENIADEVLDISPGGARVRVRQALVKGEPVTLEIKDRQTGETFRARGEVRWCEPRRSLGGQTFMVGMQFGEVYTPVGRRETFTVGPPPKGTIVEGASAALEKRRAARFRVDDYIVTCQPPGTLSSIGLKRNLAREILDLSREGARITLSEALEPGMIVQFTLHLNKFGDTLESRAEVRWCRPEVRTSGASHQVGLRFMDLPIEKQKRIDYMMGWFTSYQHRYRKEQGKA
jgi:Tfp pilus assembly protein PilZ